MPFKEAGVPTVTVVSGDVHPHFHQPSDTADTIDPDIVKSVARYVLALAWQLANVTRNPHEAREAEAERKIALHMHQLRPPYSLRKSSS